MDDYVEAAPIYRNDGTAGQPVIRPHENYDPHMKQEPTLPESQQRQQESSKAVQKSRECDKHTWFVARLRIGPVTTSLKVDRFKFEGQ